MSKSGYNKIIIIMLLLAFTGQSFAALMMPCQFGPQMFRTINMDEMAGMGHAGMDHVGMNHSAMATMDHSGFGGTDPAEPMGCCKTKGHCSAGICSLTFLGYSFNLLLIPTQTDVNLFYARVSPKILASELFRPPILC